MSNVVFTTEGQAKVLADQEAVAKKAREVKDEFEAGAKATKSWDSNLAQLKRQGESALRSIQTEQEKIVKQIDNIKAAQGKGLIPPAEAEEAIAKLRQKWVEVDAATVAAKEKQEEFTASQADLEKAAKQALRSIQTEQDKIAEQITAIQLAQEEGIIPPEEAERAIKRLEERWIEVDEATIAAKEQTRQYELEQQRLRTSAESVLGSVRTEYEKIEQQIKVVEQAMADGLVPPDKAELSIGRLREQLEALEEPIDKTGDRFAGLAKKIITSFDPTNFKNLTRIAGFLGVPLGIAGGLKAINAELAKTRDLANKLQTFQAKEKESEIGLARTLLGEGTSRDEIREALEGSEKLSTDLGVPADVLRAAFSNAVQQGYRVRQIMQALDRVAPLYPGADSKEIPKAVLDFLDPSRGPQYTPSRKELEDVTGGLSPIDTEARLQAEAEKITRNVSAGVQDRLTEGAAAALQQTIENIGLGGTFGTTFSAGDKLSDAADKLAAAAEAITPRAGALGTPRTPLLPAGSPELAAVLQSLNAMVVELQGLRRDSGGGGIGN